MYILNVLNLLKIVYIHRVTRKLIFFFIRAQNVKLSKDLKVLFLSFKNFRLNINASSKALNKCTTIC